MNQLRDGRVRVSRIAGRPLRWSRWLLWGAIASAGMAHGNFGHSPFVHGRVPNGIRHLFGARALPLCQEPAYHLGFDHTSPLGVPDAGGNTKRNLRLARRNCGAGKRGQ